MAKTELLRVQQASLRPIRGQPCAGPTRCGLFLTVAGAACLLATFPRSALPGETAAPVSRQFPVSCIETVIRNSSAWSHDREGPGEVVRRQ